MSVSTPLIAGFVWVLLSAGVAMLPMKMQYAPGLVLLIAAPFLIAWIGMEHGWLFGVIGLLALYSMFRNPLNYLARRALGRGKPGSGEGD